jgi:ACR3 family arsenite transporter
MSSVSEARPRVARPGLGTFERYLTLWVALCIIAGIVLGQLMPAPFQTLGRMTVAEVNIPVAILIWLMIVPMLLKVDFGALQPDLDSRTGFRHREWQKCWRLIKPGQKCGAKL